MIYRSNLKYQLVEDFSIQVPIYLGKTISCNYIQLRGEEGWWMESQRRVLYIEAGYTWDGPSGPVVDVDWLMTPSLVHDALYDLIREGKLGLSWKEQVDNIFCDLAYQRAPVNDEGEVEIWAESLIEGMRLGLRYLADIAASPKGRRPITEVK